MSSRRHPSPSPSRESHVTVDDSDPEQQKQKLWQDLLLKLTEEEKEVGVKKIPGRSRADISDTSAKSPWARKTILTLGTLFSNINRNLSR